jgi:hypothetical protein
LLPVACRLRAWRLLLVFEARRCFVPGMVHSSELGWPMMCSRCWFNVLADWCKQQTLCQWFAASVCVCSQVLGHCMVALRSR